MSSPLLSSDELLQVQKIAELGMVSTVTILRRTTVPAGSDEYDDGLTFVTQSATVKGWLYSKPVPVAVVDAGAIVTVNTYRLFLPVGTTISPGDQVTIGGREFTVSDTTSESTWPALLTVSLRGRE